MRKLSKPKLWLTRDVVAALAAKYTPSANISLNCTQAGHSTCLLGCTGSAAGVLPWRP